MHFNKTGSIEGAKIDQYLLEKSRLVYQVSTSKVTSIKALHNVYITWTKITYESLTYEHVTNTRLAKNLFSFKLYESNCKTDSHSKVQGEDFCESFFLWIVWGIACCAKVASCLHIIQLKSSTLLQEQTFSKHNYVLVGSSISSLFWLVAQKDDLCAIVFETFLLKKSACGQV